MRRVIISLSIMVVCLLLAIPSMAASIVGYGVFTSHSYYVDSDKTSYGYIWYLDADAETNAWYKCSDIGVDDYTKMTYFPSYSTNDVKDYGAWWHGDPSNDWGGFSFWFAVGNLDNPDDEEAYTLPEDVYRFVPFVKNVSLDGNTIYWSGSNDPNLDEYRVRAYVPGTADLIFSETISPNQNDKYSFTITDELDGYSQVQLSLEAYELDADGKTLNRSRYIMNYTPVPIPGSGLLMLSALGLLGMTRRRIIVDERQLELPIDDN